MAIEIRAARPDDYETVGELTYLAYTSDRPVSERYANDLRDAAGRAMHTDLLVAVDEGEIVGTATVAYYGRRWSDIAREGEAELRMLAVSPKRRNGGVGEALTHASIDRARRSGARRLVLSTRPWMDPAQRLYERMGFRRTPERDWFVDGPLMVYEYDLSTSTPSSDSAKREVGS